jgi:integration host factor subunit beta
MIKSELVQRIAGQNPHLFHRGIDNIVNAILGAIIAATPANPPARAVRPR